MGYNKHHKTAENIQFGNQILSTQLEYSDKTVIGAKYLVCSHYTNITYVLRRDNYFSLTTRSL